MSSRRSTAEIVGRRPVADDPAPLAGAAHRFSWHGGEGLPELVMFEDTRLLAKVLFSWMDEIASGRVDEGGRRSFVAAAG
jgi:hypothetical protein